MIKFVIIAIAPSAYAVHLQGGSLFYGLLNSYFRPEHLAVNPDTAADLVTARKLLVSPAEDENEKLKQKSAYSEYMYESLMKQFDVEGYNKMLDQVLSEDGQQRFTQALATLRLKLPHCDGGENIVASPDSVAMFPGGPLRRNAGFDLTQWISTQLMNVANGVGGGNPVVSMMAMMATTSVVGIVSAVLATIMDIVPPMIPPPIWIMRPFPCLPMLTGFNCLGSILYPITIPDFMIAHVTDQIMNGVINSFPAKYSQKVGRANNAAYFTCATVYLGMYCASIFPMCWLPIGLNEAQSFPVCLPQCLLTLVACPGFWLDDIKGPCGAISVPPFCSFSAFINHSLIPPQYSTYEESHPYPQECPNFDPDLDTPEDLWDPAPPAESPILDAATEPPVEGVKTSESLIKEPPEIVEPIYAVPKCADGCTVYDNAAGPRVCEACSICRDAQRLTTTPVPQPPIITINIGQAAADDTDNDASGATRGHILPAQ